MTTRQSRISKVIKSKLSSLITLFLTLILILPTIAIRILDEKVLKEKVDKAREKRLRKEKLQGDTLATAVTEEDTALLNASDWVKRSRIKVMTKPAEIKVEKPAVTDNNYNSAELAGLKVMHGSEDFEIGDSMILTLADAPLMETDGRKIIGLRDDGDLLENVNLSEKDRRIDREKRQKKLKQPIYSAYDDAEFDEDGNRKKSVLSQYDQEQKVGPKLVLNNQGIAMENSERFTSSILPSDASKAVVEDSLKVDLQAMKDFYTKDEYATFSKTKGKGKKARKIRQREDDEDAGASTTVVESVNMDVSEEKYSVSAQQSSDFLQPVSVPSSSSLDHGSRAKRAAESLTGAQQAQIDAAKKRDAYDIATQISLQKTQSHPSFQKTIVTAGDVEVSDYDINASLARIKRIESNRQASSTLPSSFSSAAAETEDKGARGILDRLGQLKNIHVKGEAGDTAGTEAEAGVYVSNTKHIHGLGNNYAAEGTDELRFDEVDADGRRSDGSLIFTSTTEFTTRLQATLNEKARTKAEVAVKAALVQDTDKKPKATDASRSTGEGEGGWTDLSAAQPRYRTKTIEEDEEEEQADTMKVVEEDGEGEEGDGEEDEEEDDQLEFHHQPLVARGMAATLALLKSSGELHQKEELAGRAKDARDFDPSSSKDYDVKLEYRDEFGRKLTQKEAFRQLSYRFHGYGPGKKKLDKRLKTLEDQNRAMSSRGTLESGTMRSLLQTQEATGKAHVVVQVYINFIHT